MEGHSVHIQRSLRPGIFSFRLNQISYAGSAGGRRKVPLSTQETFRKVLFVGQSAAIKKTSEALFSSERLISLRFTSAPTRQHSVDYCVPQTTAKKHDKGIIPMATDTSPWGPRSLNATLPSFVFIEHRLHVISNKRHAK